MTFRRHSAAHLGAIVGNSMLVATLSVGCGASIPRLALGPYAGPADETRTHLLESVAASPHEVIQMNPDGASFEVASHTPGYSFEVRLDERGVVHLMPHGARVFDDLNALRMPGTVRDEYLALAESLRERSFQTAPITSREAIPQVSFDAREVVNPIERHLGPDQGLLIAGGVTLGIGYLMSVLAGAWDQGLNLCGSSDARQGCDAYPFAFIPLGGAIPAVTMTLTSPRRPDDTLPPSFFLGVFSIYAQLTGVVTMIIGAVQDTKDIVPGSIVSASLSQGVRLSASLTAPSSEAGFSLSLTF